MDKQQKALFQRDPAPWEFDEQTERLVATVVFADVPYGPFDYLVPDSLRGQVEAGQRVRVPLGRGNRSIVGYCAQLRNDAAGGRALKEIKATVEGKSLLSPAMLRLSEWMADRYLCEQGQVIDAILPAGVRGQAGTREVTLLTVPTNVAAKITQLKLPPKQAAALKHLCMSSRPLTPPQLAAAAGCTMAPITALRKKGLIQAETRRQMNAAEDAPPERRQDALQLNDDQQVALDTIVSALDAARHQTVLVHGITGSGKTEIYIRAIDHVIHFGRQAIVLVPEISLTPQTRQRFRARFDRVAVLHSHMSDAERHWHWQQIARGEVQVIVGARSAVFAPTPHLGLIVLDEEHDGSFKQDKIPRYHAREVALHRTKMENVPLVLGSATPSLESWQRASDGEFHRVDMPRRVLNLPLPNVQAIDLRTEFQSKASRGAVSRPLHIAIHQAVKDGGQVILLLNRRGFSTSIQCPSCGHAVRCPDCDIALTHHREGDKAVCHYCDYGIPTPTSCPSCTFEGIRFAGLGTQRLEAEVRGRFPQASVLRMDSDTMRKPGSHESALDRFRAGEVQILLGTQMIAKGLDFPNVTLVGVINADTALHLPDFRAAERTFQLVTQVAGRTGRGEKGGRVLVQTFTPEHPAIQAALRHDFARFADQELPVRREFDYPPWTSMIRLVIRGSTGPTTEEFSKYLMQRVRAAIAEHELEARVLGPAPAPIEKLRGKFRFHALVSGSDAAGLRAAMRQAAKDLRPPDGVLWIIDVDPVDML